jgi:hypothetical protein
LEQNRAKSVMVLSAQNGIKKANGRSKGPYQPQPQAEILQTGGESSKLAVGVALG